MPDHGEETIPSEVPMPALDVLPWLQPVSDSLLPHLERRLTNARPRLLHHVRRRGVPWESAEDIVQQTCIEAWRHLDSLRSPASFDAWLDGHLSQLAGERAPLILVPTFVNGNGPFDFILDTGASHCLLSTELARMLSITPGKASEARDAGGTLQVFEVRAVQLSVGETTRRNILVGIADLQALSKTLGTPISGDLGSNFLAGSKLTAILLHNQHRQSIKHNNSKISCFVRSKRQASFPKIGSIVIGFSVAPKMPFDIAQIVP